MPLGHKLLLVALLGGILPACGGNGASVTCPPPPGEFEVVPLCGTDQLQFVPSEATAPAGEITVELTCQRATPHTFVVEEQGDALVTECTGGETNSGTIALAPGQYTFYCDIPGHRNAGMEGTLTVEG